MQVWVRLVDVHGREIEAEWYSPKRVTFEVKTLRDSDEIYFSSEPVRFDEAASEVRIGGYQFFGQGFELPIMWLPGYGPGSHA